MGIKLDKNTGTWTAFFSKRHPITRQPHSLRRTGYKTQVEARRAEMELAVMVDRKLHEAVVPKWIPLVDEYRKVSIEKGMTGNPWQGIVELFGFSK